MGSITFLQAVNASLKRARVIQGDAGELATSTVTSTATGLIATGAFEDSGRQVQIDLAIQLWNESIQLAYSFGLLPNEAASATIVLASGQREYDMPDDFSAFAGKTKEDRVFRGATTGLIVSEYRGGYTRMLRDQPVATDFTGSPNHYAISPLEGSKIRLDREPTDGEAGDTYNALYEKRLALTATMATDTLPLPDDSADALVPVIAEAHTSIMRDEATFDGALFENSLARAIKRATRTQPSRHYGRKRS